MSWDSLVALSPARLIALTHGQVRYQAQQQLNNLMVGVTATAACQSKDGHASLTREIQRLTKLSNG